MPRQPLYEPITVPQRVSSVVTIDYSHVLHRGGLSPLPRRHDCEIHAYVLMTKPVHLLVTPRKPLAIAKLMQSVGRHYVRYVNDAPKFRVSLQQL
jgi:putative transposase